GTISGADSLDRVIDSPGRIERIGPIAVDNGKPPQTAKVLRHYGVRGYLGDGDGYPVAVVLDHEDYRQALAAGPVQGLKYISFGRCGISHTAKDTRVRIVVFDGPAQTRRVLGMIARRGGNAPDADGDFCEVIAHMPAAAGDVFRF